MTAPRGTEKKVAKLLASCIWLMRSRSDPEIKLSDASNVTVDVRSISTRNKRAGGFFAAVGMRHFKPENPILQEHADSSVLPGADVRDRPHSTHCPPDMNDPAGQGSRGGGVVLLGGAGVVEVPSVSVCTAAAVEVVVTVAAAWVVVQPTVLVAGADVELDGDDDADTAAVLLELVGAVLFESELVVGAGVEVPDVVAACVLELVAAAVVVELVVEACEVVVMCGDVLELVAAVVVVELDVAACEVEVMRGDVVVGGAVVVLLADVVVAALVVVVDVEVGGAGAVLEVVGSGVVGGEVEVATQNGQNGPPWSTHTHSMARLSELLSKVSNPAGTKGMCPCVGPVSPQKFVCLPWMKKPLYCPAGTQAAPRYSPHN